MRFNLNSTLRPIGGIALLAFVLMALSSCTIVVKNKKPADDDVVVVKNKKGLSKSLGIPPGHLPPPGLCKIWIPGKPPGHQGRAGNCHSVIKKVSPGCWLLSRSKSDPEHVQVTIFDDYDASEVVIVRYYIAKTGKFAYEEKP